MDLNDTPELAEYRARVRSWLDEHKGEAPILRGDDAIRDEHEAVAAHREWQRKLAEAGLAAVTWPAEYGGQGLGPLHQVVVNQEIGRTLGRSEGAIKSLFHRTLDELRKAMSKRGFGADYFNGE